MAQRTERRADVGQLARIGMMCAISIALSYFPEIPMAFFAPWLKLDFVYVPVLLTGFALGFPSGFAVLAVRNLFQLLRTDSGGVGQLADLLVGTAMLLPSVLVYFRVRNRKGALIGMGIGVLAMTAMGVLANRFLLLPVFLGDGFAAYMAGHPTLLWASVAPFNLVKGVTVSLVTFALYKHLSPFLKRGLKG